MATQYESKLPSAFPDTLNKLNEGQIAGYISPTNLPHQSSTTSRPPPAPTDAGAK